MMMTVRLSSYATINVYAETMHNKYKRRKTMRVEVYFNLHKRVFSVRSVRSGRVILHTKNVHIRNPQFVVREGGRQRVLRERKKNVHAFVRGDATYFDDGKCPTLDNIGYNPFRYDSFVKMPDETPVRSAERAYMQVSDGGIPTIHAEGAEP